MRSIPDFVNGVCNRGLQTLLMGKCDRNCIRTILNALKKTKSHSRPLMFVMFSQRMHINFGGEKKAYTEVILCLTKSPTAQGKANLI